ncbi:MAG: hypothetical protein MJZ69_06785 [Bacteroidaceae bacterium]|nr:hypothetical protein [Bacteroidaceae bacterium]
MGLRREQSQACLNYAETMVQIGEDNRLLASLDKEEVLNPEPRSPTEQEDFRPHGYEWFE